MGQRVRKSSTIQSTGHRFYAYDEAGRTLGEYDGNGQPLEEYVYLDGFRPVGLVRNLGTGAVPGGPKLYPILTDHLGTPRKVLDSAGVAQWSWDAKDPYGYQAPNEWLAGATFTFDLRFPGQRYDRETGLFHNGFRDYNPATGRYVQPDPLGLEGGWNPYAYVASSPLNGVDPLGLTVEYTGNGSEIAKDVIAKARIKSSHLDNMMRVLEFSKRVYTINSDTVNKSNYYNHNKREVVWNQQKFNSCIDTNPFEWSMKITVFTLCFLRTGFSMNLAMHTELKSEVFGVFQNRDLLQKNMKIL